MFQTAGSDSNASSTIETRELASQMTQAVRENGKVPRSFGLSAIARRRQRRQVWDSRRTIMIAIQFQIARQRRSREQYYCRLKASNACTNARKEANRILIHSSRLLTRAIHCFLFYYSTFSKSTYSFFSMCCSNNSHPAKCCTVPTLPSSSFTRVCKWCFHSGLS